MPCDVRNFPKGFTKWQLPNRAISLTEASQVYPSRNARPPSLFLQQCSAYQPILATMLCILAHSCNSALHISPFLQQCSAYQPILATVLGLHSSLWRLRKPNQTFGKLPFGKLHIWEVATWKMVTWRNTFQKIPNTCTAPPLKVNQYFFHLSAPPLTPREKVLKSFLCKVYISHVEEFSTIKIRKLLKSDIYVLTGIESLPKTQLLLILTSLQPVIVNL